jgi:hypothetical protein
LLHDNIDTPNPQSKEPYQTNLRCLNKEETAQRDLNSGIPQEIQNAKECFFQGSSTIGTR